MPHHYKEWPPEDKTNQTAVEGLESGSNPTLSQPPPPPNAQHGGTFIRWDNLLTSETPGYDAGACISCFRDPALVSWPMWV
jgi:hypothetical protein